MLVQVDRPLLQAFIEKCTELNISAAIVENDERNNVVLLDVCGSDDARVYYRLGMWFGRYRLMRKL